MAWIAVLLCSYVLGAIPFGYLVARARGIDIRAIGSGNIGATNVTRALGRTAGLIVLLLDVLKGFVPAASAHYFLALPPFLGDRQEWALLAGFCAVAGHCLSPFLGFRGGKGVATGLGMMLGTTPAVAGLVLGVFLLSLFLSRYVSLSSILAAAIIAPSGWLLGDPSSLIVAYALFFLFIVFRHRTNVSSLLAGTERKFTFGRGGAVAPPPDSECGSGEQDALTGQGATKPC